MKANLIVGLMLLVSVQAFAQVKCYKYPGNPVFQAGKDGEWDENLFDFDIIFENNEYHMWYLGLRKDSPNKSSFGFASSPDGIHWEKYEGNPLMFNSDSIGWGNNFGTFDIIRKDSMYLMWYSSDPADSKLTSCIGFAWSTDGLTWYNHPEPVLTPGRGNAWDGNGVSNPNVIFDGQIYHMWFSGWAKRIPRTARIGYATSRDGINWKKYAANPVISIGEPGTWDDHWVVGSNVAFNGSIFELWYFGWNLVKFEIGLATSRDGISWKKSRENPVLKTGGLGTWDAMLFGSKVLSHGPDYSLWYAGSNNVRVAYGYATTCLAEAENWRETIIETQQRVIRVQVFNRLEYIN
ncbi:MAG: hypothetical protein KAR09_08455, partial [Bacteroidales bacterium]|nr:hypothetical protein [Bacteroidales bacterium]